MDAVNSLRPGTKDGLAILAFKVQALQFDLNRDLQFISMKDQLIRGRTLVLAAAKAGLVNPGRSLANGSPNIIVVGGGVGGVSAALMACELGLTVQLVESTSACFSLLGLGSDRLFSATVYDWPHEHSGGHSFPYMEPLRNKETISNLKKKAAVLRFPDVPKTGAEMRKSFLLQLDKYKEKYRDNIEIIYEHSLHSMDDVAVNEASGRVRVDVYGKGGVRNLNAQIVIFAIGFGLGKSNEQTLAARDFFSYNELESDINKALNGKGKIRIFGGGDGGLQEALRFCLDPNWHDLGGCVNELREILRNANHGAHWAQMCGRIQSAEDQAVRASMWGYEDGCVYQELDQIYWREMEELNNLAPAALKIWYERVVRKVEIEIELVDELKFSKKVYGLNRWLVGLLIRLSVKGSGRASLFRKTSEMIRSSGNEAPDVELRRIGFSSVSKQEQVGTAGSEDLLRRLAFQGIPMNLDPVV
ncbi:FAD-dependent oxidoreductase [Achromobacter ruhlandii]|uniref:FAD-dependent oxidoreductase 2 FAD binding domain-containing protein n=1 Tax=Achromobacter ruhlandii TaxID=72557 RepID=A0A6S7D730_9BURK|nr:FAD-dependent oxidoreductase [Achromobacter ruhlandii]CAB3835209.1 hypothetical protein LMG3328_00969 [Achromobacter ruhlandii]